jgi:hypothetical protein
MRDCLRRVLGWGYRCSDGRYKMAAYAHAAFETTGEDLFSSQD